MILILCGCVLYLAAWHAFIVKNSNYCRSLYVKWRVTVLLRRAQARQPGFRNSAFALVFGLTDFFTKDRHSWGIFNDLNASTHRALNSGTE